MRFKLQEKVPYADSLRWGFNQTYYEQAGLDAWLKQEVPFNITSNSCAATQIAKLAATAFKPSNHPLYFLETGAGLGLFALHFLDAFFMAYYKKHRKKPKVEYWLTDFSLQTLKDARKHPIFEPWLEKGVLHFAHMDLTQPTALSSLEGEALNFQDHHWHMILGNYQHSPLKQRVFCQQLGEWYEKHTELYYWLAGTPEHPASDSVLEQTKEALSQRLLQLRFEEQVPSDHPQSQDFKALDEALISCAQNLTTAPQEALVDDLKQWLTAQLTQELPDHLAPLITPLILKPFFDFQSFELSQTEEVSFYDKINLEEVISHPEHRNTLKEFEIYPQSTLVYPETTLYAFENWLPHLAPEGFILTIDKGHYHPDCTQGFYEVEATIHGNSLAHPVNFPLLAIHFEQLNHPTLSTQDPSYALQTQLISKGPLSPELRQQFQALFVDNNPNEDSHAFLEAGHLFMNQGQLHKAVTFFLKALKRRPNDATLLYFLAVAYLNLEQYSKAIECLESPHDDVFGILNFDILKAETYRLLENYEKAVPAYLRTLKSFGESSLVYYNLGLCYEALENQKLAQEAFLNAHHLDPEDPEIQKACGHV